MTRQVFDPVNMASGVCFFIPCCSVTQPDININQQHPFSWDKDGHWEN